MVISSWGACEPSVWNRICRIGMIAINEKMFSMADKMLNTTDHTRYFLYGGTNLLRTCMNSFMLLW